MSKKKTQKRPCFMCDGSGQMCNICGEAEPVCSCEKLDFRDCEDCEGTGVASADRDKDDES